MEERTIIIGRDGNQSFPITQSGVSSQHASLTIHSNGQWILKDLNSTNGTYICNQQGTFERIDTKIVMPDTIVRLGPSDNILCLKCTAMQFVKDDPQDFSYEFQALAKKWETFSMQRSAVEKKIQRLTFLPIVASICMLAVTFTTTDIVKIRALMFLPSVIAPFTNAYGRKKLKALNEEAKNTFVCPNPACGMPLTEVEIKKGRCLKCKAHI